MATPPIINRVAPEDRQRLQTPLTDGTMSALRQMGVNRLLRPVMTPETEQELMAAGYVRQSLGGLQLTDIGQVRAMIEVGQ